MHATSSEVQQHVYFPVITDHHTLAGNLGSQTRQEGSKLRCSSPS